MTDEAGPLLESERRLLASIAGHPHKILRTYEAIGGRLSVDTHRDVLAALVHLATTDRPSTLTAVAFGFSTRGKGEKRFVAAAARAREMIAFADPELDLEGELRFLGTAYGFREARTQLPDPSSFESRHASLDEYADAAEDYARRLRDAATALKPLTSTQLAVHLDDALRESLDDDDSADWLIEGLVGKQSIGMLAGPPQTGKSTLAVQLALCLANGRDVLNRRVFAPKRILYLIAEGSRAQYLQRVGVAARALNLARPSGPWFVQANNADVFDIARPGFESIIANAKPDLVILDTCYKFAPGTNENHADEWRAKIYGPLFRLSGKLATSFLLLHHENKSKDQKTGPDSVAGTYAQFADTDTFMRLRQDDENGNMTLHLDKVRGRPKMTLPLTFDTERALFFAGHVQRRPVSEDSIKPLVLAIIAELAPAGEGDGYVTGVAILKRLNETNKPVETSTTGLAAALAVLLESGAVERKARMQHYRIPPVQKVLEFKVPG